MRGRRGRSIAQALIVLASLGCEAKVQPTKTLAVDPASPPPSPQAESATPPRAEAPPPVVPDDAPAPPEEVVPAAAIPPVDAIPPLDLSTPPEDRAEKAASLHDEGMQHVQAERWPEAAASLHAALAEDPGHMLARYTLGSVYAHTGDEASAIAILEHFAEEGSPASLGRLLAARSDDAWSGLVDDPRLRALTDGVDDRLPKLKEAAKAVQRYLADPKRGIPAIVARRLSVEVESEISTCSAEDGDDCTTTRTLAGADELAAWMEEIPQEWMNGFETGGALTCAESCCQVPFGKDKDKQFAEFGLSHSTLYLKELCFHVDTGVAVHLTTLRVLDGG